MDLWLILHHVLPLTDLEQDALQRIVGLNGQFDLRGWGTSTFLR